ncbi:MAG: S8 family serine peptidase [Gemmatimonadaceae bacterium]
MTRSIYSGLAVLAVVSLAACSEAPVSPNDGPDAPETVVLSVNAGGAEQVMAGEIIVTLNDGVSAAEVANAHGLRVGQSGYRNSFVIMHGNAGAERANANALRGDRRVESADPNFLRQPTVINPNLWAFYNPGGLNMNYSRGKSSGQPINSSYASITDADEDNIEGYAAGGADVVIGSIDTGVDFSHSEFTGRLIAGRDWYNNDNDPSDDDGHGTHTSGTMAGETVGVAGVSGAAPHVRIYVQKVCGRRGCPSSAIASAIEAAADYPGMVAMNLSLGGASSTQAEINAVNYATGKNVLVIASAGNDGTGTVSCPACIASAMSVAATNWRDALASYSNYGPGIDIAAPGGECYSNTTPEGCIYSAYNGGGYAWLQGTSMAAPQVTGTAAIVASKTGLRGAALRSRIESNADDKGAPGYDTSFGNGRLNSYRAVTGSVLAFPQ